MTTDRLRQEIGQFLGFSIPEAPVALVSHNVVEEHGYRRIRVSYASPEAESIPAFLLLPNGDGPFAAVLVHHQHHGQRHIGKSEVCGLAGDPLQAFGPALARHGLVILAPTLSVLKIDKRIVQARRQTKRQILSSTTMKCNTACCAATRSCAKF